MNPFNWRLLCRCVKGEITNQMMQMILITKYIYYYWILFTLHADRVFRTLFSLSMSNVKTVCVNEQTHARLLYTYVRNELESWGHDRGIPLNTCKLVIGVSRVLVWHDVLLCDSLFMIIPHSIFFNFTVYEVYQNCKGILNLIHIGFFSSGIIKSYFYPTFYFGDIRGSEIQTIKTRRFTTVCHSKVILNRQYSL